VKVLLDTVVFVRLAADPEALPRALTRAIDGAHQVFFSAASTWEIAIKASIKKVKLPAPVSEYVPSRMEHFGIERLSVTNEHAAAVEALPWHHRDPFDRILVAQAILEGLTIVTTDRIFSKYDVHVVSATGRGRRK
jgi:PIN domain nuclease of toxin-antitoxin system